MKKDYLVLFFGLTLNVLSYSLSEKEFIAFKNNFSKMRCKNLAECLLKKVDTQNKNALKQELLCLSPQQSAEILRKLDKDSQRLMKEYDSHYSSKENLTAKAGLGVLGLGTFLTGAYYDCGPMGLVGAMLLLYGGEAYLNGLVTNNVISILKEQCKNIEYWQNLLKDPDYFSSKKREELITRLSTES